MAVVHTEYWRKEKIYLENRAVDKDIISYIQKYQPENYEDVLEKDERWEVFYHLSPMRASILNWYPFKKNAELLEIGGGMGALTPLFCNKVNHVTSVEKSDARAWAIAERCRNYDNLDIYIADFKDIPAEKKYDYVIALGILESQNIQSKRLEEYSKILLCMKNFLKPGGKLIIATENRLGMRYFCGAIDCKTKKAFDGINGYEGRTSRYSFSKSELEQILYAAGIENYKFYFPLPDYKLTQVVYAEGNMPDASIRDRVIPYYENKQTLLVSELDLMDSMIENKTLDKFANSFLIECSDEDYCSVKYVTLSTDRGKERALATKITENNTVCKCALFPEGKNTLVKSMNYIEDIEKHGGNIVPHKMNENNEIEMPYIDAPTLMEYLSEMLKRDVSEFYKVLDELNAIIENSSEHISTEENVLREKYPDVEDWGIILSKAYIDMVPMNCFYKDKKIYFYDQEFVKEKFPAKYIMFRTLLYIYIFITDAETVCPRNLLQERYQISGRLWDVFFAEEMEFVASVRKHKMYWHFHEWSQVDKGELGKRSDGLAGIVIKDETSEQDEKNNLYRVDEQLEQVKKVELLIFKEFARVCERNNLKYSLMYGSMLGAKRHGGMIPWDDDIDVAMLREDYDKLLSIADSEFADGFALQTPENDPEVFYGGYAKLRYSMSAGFESKNLGKNTNHGIWIDIFPLDAYDINKHSQRAKIRKIQEMIFLKVYGVQYEGFCEKSEKEKKWIWLKSRFFSHKFLCKKLVNQVKRNLDTDYDKVAILCRYLSDEQQQIFSKQDFEEPEKICFEGMEVYIAQNSDRYLKNLYGEFYMKIPPKEYQIPHHKAIFNTKISYDVLESKVWNGKPTKKIVLFGAGSLAQKYLSRYEKKYSPLFIVSNEERLYGKVKYGYLVDEPEMILKYGKDKLTVIICEENYIDVEKQLTSMEINDYRIYI